MSRIDDLIQELCPEGVPFLSLTSVAKIARGLTYQKTDEDPAGDVLVLRANNIDQQSNTIDMSDVKRLRSGFQAKPLTKLSVGDILLTAASGSRAHVGKVAYVFEEIDAYFGGFMIALRTSNQVEGRYLFHFLTSSFFRDYLHAALSTSTINNINSVILTGFRLPVPPLEVQREIVSILDKFTQLEAELEAELEARKVQYEETRNNLLNFDQDLSSHPLSEMIRELCPEGVHSESLADFSDIKSGEFVKRTEQDPDAAYPVYNGGTTETGYYKDFNSSEDSVVISSRGSIGFVNYLKTKFWAGNSCFVIRSGTPEIQNKYLFHFLKSREGELYSLKAVGGIPALNLAPVRKFQIPIPPLEIQREIVSILDKLDTLVNDISFGLPAEIAARRKQYEYYRNKLLTFKELDAA